jgi:pimeloyl-[acyl-carrier protein] methyl ester esterase
MRRAFLPGWSAAPAVWDGFGASAAIEPGVELVGWSLGALRALELATQVDVAGLVLVAATPQFVRAGAWRDGRPARMVERMRARLAEDPVALVAEFHASLFAPGETPVAIPAEEDVSVLDEGLRYLERFSVLGRLEEIRCPVRLLHGGRDAIVPLAAAEHLAATLPRADLTVWDEAGHAPQLTQPARFRAWLD